MAHPTVSVPVVLGAGRRNAKRVLTIVAWLGIVTLAVPLALTEMVFQVRRMRSALSARR